MRRAKNNFFSYAPFFHLQGIHVITVSWHVITSGRHSPQSEAELQASSVRGSSFPSYAGRNQLLQKQMLLLVLFFDLEQSTAFMHSWRRSKEPKIIL